MHPQRRDPNTGRWLPKPILMSSRTGKSDPLPNDAKKSVVMKQNYQLLEILKGIKGEYVFAPPGTTEKDWWYSANLPWCCTQLTNFVPWLQPSCLFTVSDRELSSKSTRVELIRCKGSWGHFDITSKHYKLRDCYIPAELRNALQLNNDKQQTIIRYFTPN